MVCVSYLGRRCAVVLWWSCQHYENGRQTANETEVYNEEHRRETQQRTVVTIRLDMIPVVQQLPRPELRIIRRAETLCERHIRSAALVTFSLTGLDIASRLHCLIRATITVLCSRYGWI